MSPSASIAITRFMLRDLRAASKKGRARAAVETIAITAPLSLRMWA